MLESSEVDDYGVPLCKTYYTEKANSPIILTADDIFTNAEKHIYNGNGAKNIKCISNQFIEMFWITNNISKVQFMRK